MTQSSFLHINDYGFQQFFAMVVIGDHLYKIADFFKNSLSIISSANLQKTDYLKIMWRYGFRHTLNIF